MSSERAEICREERQERLNLSSERNKICREERQGCLLRRSPRFTYAKCDSVHERATELGEAERSEGGQGDRESCDGGAREVGKISATTIIRHVTSTDDGAVDGRGMTWRWMASS